MCTNSVFKFFLLAFVFISVSTGLKAQIPDLQDQEEVVLEDEEIADNDTINGDDEERIRETTEMLDAKVEYSAEDTIYHDIRNRRVYIYGNADLQYEEMHLQADYIEIDFNNNELRATGLPDSAGVIQGRPVFSEGNQSFQSDELRYNFNTERGRTIGVVTEEADGYVHGDVVKIQPSREVHVAEGKYTTCDDPDPHFHIEFRRAKIIPDDKIVSSFAYLVIQDVPTPLFVPFGFFPNRRGQSSGILIPSYGESNNRGFYLENGGFYWGISDYIDLSIRGDIYSRGSWALRLGSDYRKRYRYNGSINLSYADNVMGEPNLPGYERSKDFRIQWTHNQAPEAHPTRNFRANVNAGTRQASRFNPVSDEDYLANTFSSNISYSRSWANTYNFSANLRHSQNTNTAMVNLSLPDISFSVNRFYPFRSDRQSGHDRWYDDINVSYNMSGRNELNLPDSLLLTSNALTQFRSGVRHEIPVSYSGRLLNHFNFSTSINYSEKWYYQTIRKSWEEDHTDDDVQNPASGTAVTDTVFDFESAREFRLSSSVSTRLYGMMQFQSGPVSAIRHVLTPSVGISFRPDFADPFWGYYKEYYDPQQNQQVQYSIFEQSLFGGPPAGRSGNINFSLTNNFEMKVRSFRDPDGEPRKITLIDNLRVSGGYDLARDSLNFSDIRLSGRTRLFDDIDISYSSSWTPYARNEDGQYVDDFVWNTDKQLLRLNNTSWSLNFNYRLQSGDRNGQGNGNGNGGPRQGMNGQSTHDQGPDADMPGEEDSGERMADIIPADGVDYSVPWNMTISYSFNYNARYRHQENTMDRDFIQNLSLRGDISLTPNWRIGFRTGYDFEHNELTYTSIDVYRDLHCWEMTFNWIPMGFRKSYNLTIRVKSSVLQDLKIRRRSHHLDRMFD
ncbi:MAG: putative LPS assembly protein LptD [Bacteroidota bacterium]